MGDISEMRGLITIATIVSVTVALVLLMPSQFYTTSYNQDLTNNPATRDVTNLLAWNQTYSWNITGYNPVLPINLEQQIGGYQYWYWSNPDGVMALHTFAGWWIFKWDIDDFHFYNATTHADLSIYNILNEPELNLTALDVAGAESGTILTIENDKSEATLSLVFDNSTYTGFVDALENDGLILVFNLDWNDRLTSINALSLIGMVLFGALPGIDPILNGLFAFIGWGIAACVAYLMFIFTLRIIGAVFGGGGA